MRTLRDLAHARSGDKGDTSNVSVIAYWVRHPYRLLRHASATAEGKGATPPVTQSASAIGYSAPMIFHTRTLSTAAKFCPAGPVCSGRNGW